MTQLNEYIVNESAEFSTMENNPMIYTLIIPKVLKADPKDVKADEVVKNAVNATEKFLRKLNKNTLKELKDQFKPYAVMDIFKMSHNYKATFDKYFIDFKSIICNNEANFIKCMELDKQITELYNSPEYQIYKNTL